jgi:Tfp pilus assembly protein PilF
MKSDIYFELGNSLHAAGKYDQAADSYRQAIEFRPDHAQAFHNLGVTRMIQRRPLEAIAAYEQAVRIKPDYPEPHQNLGALMQRLGRDDRALYHYGQALQFAPQSVEVRYNLALLAQERDMLDDAIRGYRQILERRPDHADARNNLGNALVALGRPEEAIAHYRRAKSVESKWNLGLAQLLLGEFEEGWRGHEWRLRRREAERRAFRQPRWDGSPLEGKRILLHAEQGLGDTIQFARYAPLVGRRGGVVILECQPPLSRLLDGTEGVEELVARGNALPEFDCHAPLLSVPGIFQTSPATIPAQVPYIRTNAADVERWREIILSRMDGRRGLKVGLTWAGNPLHMHDGIRSMPAKELSALAGLDTVVFFNLQKDAVERPDLEMVELHDSGLHDVSAILLNLDLLISVDTSIAHLAGALNRPVWTLLPFAPDWRWMRERADSPWYPSMRLYRQERRKSWTEPLERVRKDLKKLAANKRE